MQGLGQSNLNHDFYAYNAAGQVWNGSAFVTFAVADYVAYRIAATKLGNANDASVDAWFSASTPNGAVRWELRERGASLATSPIVYTGPDAHEALVAIGLDWLFAKAWDQTNPVPPAVADSIIMQLFEPDIQPIQFGAGVLTHVPTTINSDATQTTARTNAATAATQSTAAAASAATAVSQTTPAAIRDSVNADGLDLQEALRVLLAVMAGKLEKPTALQRVYRAIDDSKARVTGTLDAQSNRVTITIDAS